ncbi:MAG: hypothetical protein ABJL11_15410 [Parasphingorhabdus sp.]
MQAGMWGQGISISAMQRKLSIYILILISAFGSTVATAQSGEPEEPFGPDKYVISPGGVNMANGRFRYENVDLDGGGLSLTRMTGPPVEESPQPIAFDDNPMGQFSHNWNIRIRNYNHVDTSTGYFPSRHLEIGDKRYLRPGGVNNPPQPCPLTPSLWIGRQLITWGGCTINIGGTYNDRIQYFANSAELGRIEFQSGIHGYCREEDKYCAASKLTRPNGTEYTFEYDVVLSRPRLRRVNSNRGFSLVFLYGSSGSLAASPTQICLINRTVHSLSAAYVCPSGVQKVSYSYTSKTHMSSFTDAVNRVHQYTSTFNAASHQANRAGYSWTEKYFRPGESAPHVTNTIKRPPIYEAIISQTFADGRSINYTWDPVAIPNTGHTSVAGGTYQETGSPVVTVEYGTYFDQGSLSLLPANGPTRIVDGLGREILADQCEITNPNPNPFLPLCNRFGRTESVTMPEGNRIEYEYSGFTTTQPTTTRYVAKPGSGQPNIEQSTDYNCLIYFLCLKPKFETDGRGNRTDYVYSTVHGGLLSKTGPADANGVQPQTRYNYVQKNAYVKNGSSYVATQPPMWVLSGEEYCKTTAASGSGCAGGAADEVVTSYDYGPASGPNNLFLRGTVTTADGQSLRTCFTYDQYGRKISETQPQGTGSVCP